MVVSPVRRRDPRRWHVWVTVPMLALTLGCQAAEFRGRVVGVLDGDTLELLTPPKTLVRVRLAEIDAPEKSQPFGQRSKQNLSDLCFGQEANVAAQAKDRYGRTIARVRCKGRDASLTQVRAGLAWAYVAYQTDASFSQVEQVARAAHTGLWQDPNPVAPWLARHPTQPTAAADATGCLTGPKGGRYRLDDQGRKHYGC